jgi:predicted transposase YdaD
MKTDVLFYSLFELEPALLVHLAHLDIPETVQYKFQAIELKDIAKRTDAVLVPDTKVAPLIIAEVQFWKDATIYDRLVSESARLRLQMREYQNLQMVVVFPSPEVDPGAGVWRGLVERGIIRIVYLNEALEEQSNNNRPEERGALWLMNLTVSPHDEPTDRTKLSAFVQSVVATKNIALQRMFRDLFVSLYTSKYKHLTIQEVRAMINTAEIFDDIHESLAVQQYGEEVAAKTKLETQLKTKLENALSFVNAGIPIEQVASILNLSIEAIEEARKNMP